MDKKCISTYIITGEQLDIVKLHGKLLKLTNSKKPILWNEKHTTSLRCVAKLFFPDWVGYDISGYFYNLKIISERKIIFTVETVNTTEPQIWFKVCQKYNISSCIYFSRIPEKGRYETNDSMGIHFPQRYLVVDTEDTVKAVISANDLYQEVSRFTAKIEPFSTLAELRRTVSRYIKRIRIFDILVVDNSGLCISSPDNLLRQIAI